MNENHRKHRISTVGQAPPVQPFTLFIPTGTKNYSMRFSIAGHGQQRIALKTAFYPDALSLAYRKYWGAVNKAESGQSLKIKTTESLIKQWMSLKRPPELHQKTSYRQTVMTRYFGSFIGNQSITDKTMASYQQWRNTYWTEGPGKDITHLEYRRARPEDALIKSPGMLIRSPVTDSMRKAPSQSTVQHENAILRDFFQWMKQEGHLSQIPSFTKPKKTKSTDNRPSFTDKELAKFRAITMKRLQQSTETNRHSRFLFWAFTEIMIDSGLRDTECLHLKWSDIINFTTDTKPIDNKLSIQIQGKSKSRTCIPNPSIIHPLQVLYAEQKPNTDDYLFTYKNGNRVSSFSEQMNETLKDADLTTDYRGVKRTCYSFRHYYITKGLNNGIDIHLLARNTGTSVSMIEKHYSHVSLEQHRDRIIPDHMRL
ncbi:tyrosine-type recombinase/integrase [Acetobacter sp.]|jgi:integrase|uniref:tyrosine-type recombinase/integrase n=1 Tax=Acetobacter sp. TaxID=440 RepID=UPI0025BEC8FC|nr:site-specific integrase [Acetobacter sp.]MCH4091223.1 site-specific integrase [Acetobacter sp.]MCI1300882.1 site-specific integrase [Acetobacter sp.]MCI1317210.1 site-specific integrase [Acetobacter sp.]